MHVEQFQHYVDDVLQYVNETREEDPDLKTLPTFLVVQCDVWVLGAVAALMTYDAVDLTRDRCWWWWW